MTAGNGTESPEWRLASGPSITEQAADELKNAYAVAWRTALGQDVQEIGAEMGLSRATVYRLIEEAKDRGFLDARPRVALPRGPGAAILLSHVLESSLGQEVRARFAELDEQRAPLEVLVTSNLGLRPEVPRDRAINERVGRVAARRLMMGILSGARVIGINWGYNCWRVSQTLPGGLAHRLPAEEARKVEVFPLVGSLGVSGEKAREHHLVETSANANAARCVENLNRYGVEPARRKAGSAEGETAQVQEAVGADPPPQLTQPCVIPQVTEGDEAERERYLRAVWRYIASDESIRTVFGAAWALRRVGLAAPPGAEGETPLLSRADTLVTGISEAARSRAVRIGAIEASLFDDAREANARGEISGHYFCHAEDAAACGEALQRINRRVVAPTITDYVACTDRAGRTRRGLGTMLLASESRKAEAVRAAVSHGAVGTLVIDEDLARAILGD